MKRVAFKMKLFSGRKEAYARLHQQMTDDLRRLLKEYSIHNYSIFLDETTHDLFAILYTNDPEKLKELGKETLMKQWWHNMVDIMETNADESPVQTPLQEVFYME